MLCMKRRRAYSFGQDATCDKKNNNNNNDNDNNNYCYGSSDRTVTTLPRNDRIRNPTATTMVVTITEDTPADMLAGNMELLVQLPDHDEFQHRVTVQRSTPMMDLLIQIATSQKLSASNYILQAIDERGFVLPHHSNTPIGSLDVLQVKLVPKQETIGTKKIKSTSSRPFETTFRLQVHLPRNQLYVSRVSPKTIIADILDQVCREKNLNKTKYELRHPVNLEESLKPSSTLQDYDLQEVTLYPKESGGEFYTDMGNQQMLTRQEDRRRLWTKQNVLGALFRIQKNKKIVNPSPVLSITLPQPQRPQRKKKRPAPKPPSVINNNENDEGIVILHSRNSSDSSGYHEPSVLSDNNESGIATRQVETLPRRTEFRSSPTSFKSTSLGNLASFSSFTNGTRKKRTAPSPPQEISNILKIEKVDESQDPENDGKSSSEEKTINEAIVETDQTDHYQPVPPSSPVIEIPKSDPSPPHLEIKSNKLPPPPPPPPPFIPLCASPPPVEIVRSNSSPIPEILKLDRCSSPPPIKTVTKILELDSPPPPIIEIPKFNSHSDLSQIELKHTIINELESRMTTKTLPKLRERLDSRDVSSIAPINNRLSNFQIATYANSKIRRSNSCCVIDSIKEPCGQSTFKESPVEEESKDIIEDKKLKILPTITLGVWSERRNDWNVQIKDDSDYKLSEVVVRKTDRVKDKERLAKRQTLPVVKGFKIEERSTKPTPAMRKKSPVVTGVTLKNSNNNHSSSNGSRDMLLESIRNFKDSHRLKSVQNGC